MDGTMTADILHNRMEPHCILQMICIMTIKGILSFQDVMIELDNIITPSMVMILMMYKNVLVEE